MIHIEPTRRAGYLLNCRILAVFSACAAGAYLVWLLFIARPDNLLVYVLLVSAELFMITQAVGFWLTISRQKWSEPHPPDFALTSEKVDVFITVCGEPCEIVERTVVGAVAIQHPRLRTWILDDGGSSAVAELAKRRGIGYLRRASRRGAKAGNINEAMARTEGDFIVIFDADHVPASDFLEKTMGAFGDPRVAFVQTPQVYENSGVNRVAAGANAQQALFYGPIMRGRAGADAVFCCGTNVVFRRAALESIGGVPEDSVTEDLRATLLLMDQGWRSIYVPIVMARGVGPSSISDYFSQQMRWARGGLEILLKRSPFSSRMRLSSRVQYALGFQYWFTGWAYLVYLVLPLAYLFMGWQPLEVPNNHPLFFLPYVVFSFASLLYAADFKLTFSTVWFTLASFPVHIAALIAAATGRRAAFVVTPKRVEDGTSTIPAVLPAVHIAASLVLVVAVVVGLLFRGGGPSTVSNIAFACGHLLILNGFIRYGLRPDIGAAMQRGQCELDTASCSSLAGLEMDT